MREKTSRNERTKDLKMVFKRVRDARIKRERRSAMKKASGPEEVA